MILTQGARGVLGFGARSAAVLVVLSTVSIASACPLCALLGRNLHSGTVGVGVGFEGPYETSADGGSGQSLGPVPISPGSWTLAILPDTQIYAESYPAIFAAQTQFLADNKTNLNIQMVLQEGDITNHSTVAEWQVASNAFQTLDNAGVRYQLAQGNHDIGPSGNATVRTSLFSTYFPTSRLAAQSTFGGVYPEADAANPGSFLPNNNYSLFSAGGKDWISFDLEFGPRNEVIDWVDATLKANPDRQGMITTHAYLYSDGTRYDWAAKGTSQSWNPHAYGVSGQPGGVNDGEEMWQKLKDNPNLKFVFNGHVLNDGTGYLASTADNGNVVHQILANYQFLSNGGQGYMRLLEFKPDGQTVEIRTYSPWLDAQSLNPYRLESDQQFSLALDSLPPPNPVIYNALGASLVATGPTIPPGNANTVDNVTVTHTGTPSVGLLQTNRGDYEPSINGGGVVYNDGIMLASITQNVREGVRATVEAGRNPYNDGYMSLSISQGGFAANQEVNVNTSMAWFDFSAGWQGAHINKDGSYAAGGGALVAGGTLTKNDIGRYDLNLNVDSRTDGLLFAIGNNNSNIIVNTGVKADGSGWDLRVQNNAANFAATGTDALFSFLYLPLDTANLIGGRYDGATQSNLASAGTFTIERLAVGDYRLTIPGETPDTGMLILTTSFETTSGGIAAPDDNILTYESDGLGHFIINSLDLTGGTTLNLQDTQFVWAFISFADPISLEPPPPNPADVNFDGVVNIFDINFISAHWGQTGAEGDANGDGIVDIFDVNLVSANWTPAGGATAVPEPSSLALLLSAGLCGLCRRRSQRR
jgi:Calcineurin-like phosphoesterase/PEP-CTERM motif